MTAQSDWTEEEVESHERWVDAHSIDCTVCGNLCDERDGNTCFSCKGVKQLSGQTVKKDGKVSGSQTYNSQINLLDPQKQELNAAVAEFLEIARNGSYSQRHPELGKMIACQVCGRRHRSARVCLPAYGRVAGTENEKGEVTISTKKQALGAAVFKGKRILKHRNAWGLQVLERATLLFREWRADPYQFTTPDDELGKHALSRALNEKRAERAADRKFRMARTRESRRVNRGL